MQFIKQFLTEIASAVLKQYPESNDIYVSQEINICSYMCILELQSITNACNIQKMTWGILITRYQTAMICKSASKICTG